MNGMEAIVSQLRAQKANFVNQIRHVDAALAVLGTHFSQKSHRTVSAAGRRKIAAAQRARWAKVRGKGNILTPKRTMSASSRRKIAAAQRARWAKIKKSKS